MVETPVRPFEFGTILRHWRRVRGLSQEALADLAGMSTRHLSFLETGRCGASREAVRDLGRALELPATEVVRLLHVAGHAGEWNSEAAPRDGAPCQLAKIAHLLGANDPFPAFITDPDWRIAWGNEGARGLVRRCAELHPGLDVEHFDLRAFLSDDRALRGLIVNHDELLSAVISGLYHLAPDPGAVDNTRSLLACLPPAMPPGEAIERAARVTIWSFPLRIRDGGVEFVLEVLPFPFAAGAHGYSLVLLRAPDPESADVARDYFVRLADAPLS
jgi:transcriptional regulator with XRE-family HTH domain